MYRCRVCLSNSNRQTNSIIKLDSIDEKSKVDSCLFDTYCYPCDCVINCLIPSLYSTVCCLIPCGAVTHRDCRNTAEFFMIRRPICCKICQCVCYSTDMMFDCDCAHAYKSYINRKNMYDKQGFFVSHNQIVIWDKEHSNALLRRETGRGPYLGPINLTSSHLPRDIRGEETGLLTITGIEKREGYDNSNHAAYRKAFEKLSWSSDCLERVNPCNETMMKITSLFEREIKACGSLKKATDRPLKCYLIRCIHWGLLELDLTHAEVEQLFFTHYGNHDIPLLWHLAGFGWCLPKSVQEDRYRNSAKIYCRSPKLASW